MWFVEIVSFFSLGLLFCPSFFPPPFVLTLQLQRSLDQFVASLIEAVECITNNFSCHVVKLCGITKFESSDCNCLYSVTHWKFANPVEVLWSHIPVIKGLYHSF